MKDGQAFSIQQTKSRRTKLIVEDDSDKIELDDINQFRVAICNKAKTIYEIVDSLKKIRGLVEFKYIKHPTLNNEDR